MVFIQQRGVRFPLGPPKKMHKVAIIEKIHQDGINLLKNNPAFEFEIIEDASEENLIKVLPNFDACTLRVSKLNEKISYKIREHSLLKVPFILAIGSKEVEEKQKGLFR